MPYADLVLEGGGVKGIGLVGAISVLEERGYEFKRVAGTSAGAIVGSLVAAGVPASELTKIMETVDYPAFCDAGPVGRTALGRAFGLLFRQGMYRGDHLRGWLTDQLERAGVRTFADLRYQDTERPLPDDRAYRLVVMASDLSQGCLRRLPWDYPRYGRDTGTEYVVDAVRASMSIPFFYTPVRWPTSEGRTSWIVDGGMLSNFPIDVFDAPTGAVPRWPTIGIKLSARPDAAQGIVNPISGAVSMTVAMVRTLTGFYDRMHIEDPSVLDRMIFVDTGKVRATDFGLSEDDQDLLYENGRRAALEFLDGTGDRPGFDFDRYVATHRTPD